MEPIINFLNHDLDIVMQKSLLALIKSELVMVPELLLEFRVYTNKDTLVKMGLQPYSYPLEAKAKAPKEAAKIIWLSFWLSFGLLLFPTIYLAQLNVGLLSLSFQQIIVGFLIETNVYLIFYFLTINLIYIILFIIALIGSKRQVNLAKTRKSSLLFTDRLLPGISIIAPAYNEEVSVVDSVLESDAILKLTSTMLDDTRPFIAMGGNIYPANGFSFDRGQVVKRSIPKGLFARLQTIEYLRAFTSGRIGWSQMRSLMIISGAPQP